MPNLFSDLPVEIFGVGARVHVRVDADRDPRAPAARGGDFRQGLEFGLRFDVEASDVFVEPERHFGAGLADAGEDDLRTRDAGGACAAQFAFRNDVHAGPEPRQRGQHRLIGIGLHRVADERPGAAKASLNTRKWRSIVAVE